MNKGISEIRAEDKMFCDFRENNDPELFGKLFRKLSPWLIKLILRISGDMDAAEDILQETWIRIVRKKGFYLPERGSFRYYLLTIAKNEAFKWKKKEDIRAERTNLFTEISDSIDFDDPSIIKERKEKADALREAIQSLNENYQDVILLFYFDDKKVNEIAELLNKPSGTIKTWLDRGREQLGKKLSLLNN